MEPTEDIYQIAPSIMRSYSISFLLLPLNIFSTYYFQSLMKPRVSIFVSITRGIVLSGILIYSLPFLITADSIWFSMPITELLVAIMVVRFIIKYTQNQEQKEMKLDYVSN